MLLSACAVTKNNSRQKTIVIKNVSVVDVVNGSLLLDQTVLILGERIIEMGPSEKINIPGDATLVNAAGKYIIPGLWDMHVHLEIAGEESLPIFIANGVTGVRDMGANSFSLLKNWRNQIESGVREGPHILAPGPMIDGPFFTSDLRVTVTTPAEARKAVDSLVTLGVDFIKIHQQISREAYLAAADQARKHKITFVGHLPNTITPIEAIEAGQKSIEHIFTAPDKLPIYPLMKQRGTRVTPTLVFLYKLARYNDSSMQNDPRASYLSPTLKAFWKTQVAAWGEGVNQTVELMNSLMPEMMSRTLSLQKAGVELLAGTDLAGVYIYPGSSLHEELELLVKAGLSPIEALQTATINPARFFNKEESMGTVQKGKSGDLVLLNANPLEKISNTKNIYMVIFKGRIYDEVKLKGMLK